MVGVVLVLVPGIALQVAAVAVWSLFERSAEGWAVLALTLMIALGATALKYLHPGRRLRAAGIPNRVLLFSVVVATIGLFVLPVVGAPLGFVLTIYLFERRRIGRTLAWPSTKTALKAVATSIGIELTGAFLITVLFVMGAFLV